MKTTLSCSKATIFFVTMAVIVLFTTVPIMGQSVDDSEPMDKNGKTEGTISGASITIISDSISGKLIESTSEDIGSEASEEGKEGGETFEDPVSETFYGKNTNLENVPKWVLLWLYPNSNKIQSLFQSVTQKSISGALSFETDDSVQTVQDYFMKKLKREGYEIGSEIMTQTGAGTSGVITGELAKEGLSIDVVLNEEAGGTKGMFNFNQKK